MTSLLRRYWFEFELPPREPRAPGGRLQIEDRPTLHLRNGIGVTGYSEDDCLQLIRAQVCHGEEPPPVTSVRIDVDVREIPEWFHRHHQVGVPPWRGVWAPPFNLWQGPT